MLITEPVRVSGEVEPHLSDTCTYSGHSVQLPLRPARRDHWNQSDQLAAGWRLSLDDGCKCDTWEAASCGAISFI